MPRHNRLRARRAYELQAATPALHAKRVQLKGRTRIWEQLEEVIAAAGIRGRSHFRQDKERTKEVDRMIKLLGNPPSSSRHPQARVAVEGNRCLRCGWVWVQQGRIPEALLPRRCPHCKSVRWFYPKDYSKGFWRRYQARRREQGEKEREWADQLAQEALEEFRRALLKGQEQKGRHRAGVMEAIRRKRELSG